MSYETVWTFKTARFSVELALRRDYGYQYDGDDEDGETQRALNDGSYVAFDSLVRVYLDGVEIASDSLGGSVYEAGRAKEFWQAHRTSSADGRNTLAMKAKNVCIGHYFPSMVREACRAARDVCCTVPKMRA